jgi:hypothetical protein
MAEALLIDLSCGAVREDKCAPCAKRNQHYRRVQIREGWHRTNEPLPAPQPATERQRALILASAQLEFERAGLLRGVDQSGIDKEQAATERNRRIAAIDEGITELEDAIAAEGLRGRVAPPRPDGDDGEDRDGPVVAANDAGPTAKRSYAAAKAGGCNTRAVSNRNAGLAPHAHFAIRGTIAWTPNARSATSPNTSPSKPPTATALTPTANSNIGTGCGTNSNAPHARTGCYPARSMRM